MLFSVYGVLSASKARAKNILELIFSWDYAEMLVLDIAGGFVVSRSLALSSVVSQDTTTLLLTQLLKILSSKGLVCHHKWYMIALT